MTIRARHSIALIALLASAVGLQGCLWWYHERHQERHERYDERGDHHERHDGHAEKHDKHDEKHEKHERHERG